MLLSRISNSSLVDPAPEDILQDSLRALFSDDLQTSHGGIGDSLTYHSPQFGDIKIKVPVSPDADRGRLFAHYLWNAAILAADLIERSSHEDMIGIGSDCWNVKGEQVLELGAGRLHIRVVETNVDLNQERHSRQSYRHFRVHTSAWRTTRPRRPSAREPLKRVSRHSSSQTEPFCGLSRSKLTTGAF